MQNVLLSVLSIYVFILMGYIAKFSFKEKIDDKTITLLNVYFLQVFLTFWGLLKRPIDSDFLYSPFLYMLIVLSVLSISMLVARIFFSDTKDRSIAMIAALIGNTGNLGIPLNIAIFGEESIPYTTIINLVNVFVVYTFGVFYYSRGSFSVKESLLNIVKLPILWAAVVAIILNIVGYRPDEIVDKTLQMGAYASMVMQLFLFGIYLYSTKIKEVSLYLITWVTSVKFILLPIVAFIVLSLVEMDAMIKGILFIELMMPLAVANVNLASLYECKPKVITALVFITSLLFLAMIFVALEVVKYL